METSEGEARAKAEGIVQGARDEAAGVGQEAEAYRQDQARLAAEAQSRREEKEKKLDELRIETASADQRFQATLQHEASARAELVQVQEALSAAKRQRQEDDELGSRRTRRGRQLRKQLAELEAENATLQTQVQGDDVQQHRALLEELAARVQENMLREQARLAKEQAKADREQARKNEALEERRKAQQERDEARKAQQEAEAATEEARRDRALGSRRTQEGRALRQTLEDTKRALEKERERGQRLTNAHTSVQQRLDPMRARAESAENRLAAERERASRAAHNARGAVFRAIETHVGPEYAQRVREAMNNETTEVRSVGQGPRRR